MKAELFEELPDQVQTDLLGWYNVAEPDDDDKAKLLALYNEGRFTAWDCPMCGDRVYEGEPENWGEFGGVNQVDYSSYPIDSEEFKPKFVAKWCDTCRCHKRNLSNKKVTIEFK